MGLELELEDYLDHPKSVNCSGKENNQIPKEQKMTFSKLSKSFF
jgi:hypothetical protein